MKAENFQRRLKSVYSVFIVVATSIICNFFLYILFLGFVLFPGTLIILAHVPKFYAKRENQNISMLSNANNVKRQMTL